MAVVRPRRRPHLGVCERSDVAHSSGVRFEIVLVASPVGRELLLITVAILRENGRT